MHYISAVMMRHEDPVTVTVYYVTCSGEICREIVVPDFNCTVPGIKMTDIPYAFNQTVMSTSSQAKAHTVLLLCGRD